MARGQLEEVEVQLGGAPGGVGDFHGPALLDPAKAARHPGIVTPLRLPSHPFKIKVTRVES